jgi:hypothetical protein
MDSNTFVVNMKANLGDLHLDDAGTFVFRSVLDRDSFEEAFSSVVQEEKESNPEYDNYSIVEHFSKGDLVDWVDESDGYFAFDFEY